MYAKSTDLLNEYKIKCIKDHNQINNIESTDKGRQGSLPIKAMEFYI